MAAHEPANLAQSLDGLKVKSRDVVYDVIV
jgi:hypothetical protein